MEEEKEKSMKESNPSPEDTGATRPAPPPPPPQPAPLRVEVKQPEPACTVVIDRELLDRLEARAKGLYRTPDQQASYYISRGLRRDGA